MQGAQVPVGESNFHNHVMIMATGYPYGREGTGEVTDYCHGVQMVGFSAFRTAQGPGHDGLLLPWLLVLLVTSRRA